MKNGMTLPETTKSVRSVTSSIKRIPFAAVSWVTPIDWRCTSSEAMVMAANRTRNTRLTGFGPCQSGRYRLSARAGKKATFKAAMAIAGSGRKGGSDAAC